MLHVVTGVEGIGDAAAAYIVMSWEADFLPAYQEVYGKGITPHGNVVIIKFPKDAWGAIDRLTTTTARARTGEEWLGELSMRNGRTFSANLGGAAWDRAAMFRWYMSCLDNHPKKKTKESDWYKGVTFGSSKNIYSFLARVLQQGARDKDIHSGVRWSWDAAALIAYATLIDQALQTATIGTRTERREAVTRALGEIGMA